MYYLDKHNMIFPQIKSYKMSQNIEILRELADLIVNASMEERSLSNSELQYFDEMFDKALELESITKK